MPTVVSSDSVPREGRSREPRASCHVPRASLAEVTAVQLSRVPPRLRSAPFESTGTLDVFHQRVLLLATKIDCTGHGIIPGMQQKLRFEFRMKSVRPELIRDSRNLH